MDWSHIQDTASTDESKLVLAMVSKVLPAEWEWELWSNTYSSDMEQVHASKIEENSKIDRLKCHCTADSIIGGAVMDKTVASRVVGRIRLQVDRNEMESVVYRDFDLDFPCVR